MKNKCLLILLLIGDALAAQTPDAADSRFAGLDTVFARVLSDWRCPGFAVAVVEKGAIVYAKGFGYADYERKKPVTPNTLFAAGSCTKAFTCALLGMLKEDGKIDFDKPVRNYLPQLNFYSNELNPVITARDMMCHRTGLPRHDLAWALFKTQSPDTLLQRVQYHQPSTTVRQQFQYNNFMFMALGKLVETLSGKPYEIFIQERIFKPLQMSSLNFSVDSMARSADAALGYTVDAAGQVIKLDYFNLDVMKAVGGINTSVSEMAKWLLLWINNGKYGGRQLLSPAYIREAITTHIMAAPGLPQVNNSDVHFSNYGLGWFLSSYRGHYRVEHGGNINGFSSNMCFFPSDSTGVVVFCNQNASSVTSVVRNIIADRLLNLPVRDWHGYLYGNHLKALAQQQILLPQKQVASTGAMTLQNPDGYEGHYSHAGYGSFTMVWNNGALLMRFPGGDTWRLKPAGPDVFDAAPLQPDEPLNAPGGTMKINFKRENGKVRTALLPLEPALPAPISFIRNDTD